MAPVQGPSRRSGAGGVLLALGGATLAVGGLVYLATREEESPTPAPPLLDGNTGIVPPHLRGDSSAPAEQPGPALGPPLPGDPTVEQVQIATDNFLRAQETWKRYLSDLAAGMGVQEDELTKAKIGLGAAGTLLTVASTIAAKVAAGAATAGAAANSVPLVGQVVAAVSAVIAFVAQWCNVFLQPQGLLASEIRRGVRLRIRPPEITGWKDGTYFCFDVPIFGPKVDEYAEQLSPKIRNGVWGEQWAALYRLAKAYPYGPPVPRVEVLGDGVYQYEWNIRGTNDRGTEAQQRGELRIAQTTKPTEITPFGPTGQPAPGQPTGAPDPAASGLDLKAGPLPAGVTSHEALRAGYVLLFEDEGAQGRAFVLPPGEYPFVEDAGIPNDAITSVWVPTGWILTIFEDRDFRGRGRAVIAPVDFLGKDWNDRLSSAKVLPLEGRPAPRLAPGPLPGDVLPDDVLKAGGVLLYEHEQYEGRVFVLPPGDYRFFGDVGIPNDLISSVRVPAGTILYAYDDRDLAGRFQAFTGDVPYVYDLSDRISSARVVRQVDPKKGGL